MDIAGKTAVITGGASGIGLATAQQLAGAGMNLVLGDIEAGPLDDAVSALRAQGAKVLGLQTDVTKEADVIALRDAAVAEFGTAHVVFNNAGVAAGPTIGTPTKVWEWVIDVDVLGVVYGMNAFVPLFIEQGEGHVVNTASLAGLGGVPGMGAYCASKFAVVGMSESLFHELAFGGHDNVGVSALCPGFVKTRIHESTRNVPGDLRSYLEDPKGQGFADIAGQAVNAGIDAGDVALAVQDAIVNKKFWILTHEHAAIRTMEQRLEWMRGAGPAGIDLLKATQP
jgi:NAD(P)-dependent dehydrogenase (short-subunit alcohol dehydrogenase family)